MYARFSARRDFHNLKSSNVMRCDNLPWYVTKNLFDVPLTSFQFPFPVQGSKPEHQNNLLIHMYFARASPSSAKWTQIGPGHWACKSKVQIQSTKDHLQVPGYTSVALSICVCKINLLLRQYNSKHIQYHWQVPSKHFITVCFPW